MNEATVLPFRRAGAEVFAPTLPTTEALARTTHLGIGAHPDDLEIMAYHGILACFQTSDAWFSGVTVTDGGGSARDHAYREHTDLEMIAVRKREQNKAAQVGDFSAMVLLDHPSAAVKLPGNEDVAADLELVLSLTRPEVVYTHNLADKHDTHVAVALRVIAAIRTMHKRDRPRSVIGCEVWRDLDWLSDADKVVMAVGGRPHLASALLGVYDSQICGGKRYDLAALGRRLAHATFFESHSVDSDQALIWGIDLTPLVEDESRDPAAFLQEHIDRFARDVKDRIKRLRG